MLNLYALSLLMLCKDQVSLANSKLVPICPCDDQSSQGCHVIALSLGVFSILTFIPIVVCL